MARLMSVSMTEQPVLDRIKNVTRRAGWLHAKPGDRVFLVRKAMGRKPGEPVVRLAEVEFLSVRREPLGDITQDDVTREGFPGMDRADFINRFFVEAQGIYPHHLVTRIQWHYLNTIPAGRIWTDDANLPDGGIRLTVKRCCNGCGRQLGDVHQNELDVAITGLPLPDVTTECGCR